MPKISLTPSQQKGFNFIVGKWEENHSDADVRLLAYILATAFHETAHTMEPVTEYGGEAYLKSKPYWPFVGRGYVQLTWESNYKKYGIDKTPEKALDPEFAAEILINGMLTGVFTGRKLSQYFNDHTEDPVNARRIINGTDKAEKIATYYRQFLDMLTS